MAEEKFQATAEEVDKLSKALKSEEFRKLFFEYAQEISDPENKQRYEEELIELEKMRGVDMKFLKPTPGFVLKSLILPEKEQKLFVNICMSEHLDPAKVKLAKDKEGKVGESWSIPYTLTPPREDCDKEKKKCTVVDAMFHPETYNKSQQSVRFKQLVIDSALDGIEQSHNIKVDRQRVKTLKQTYKGVAPSTVIRVPRKETKDCPQNVDLGDLPLKVPYPPLKDSLIKTKPPAKLTSSPSEPQYNIVYSGEFTMQDFTYDRESSRVKRPQKLLVTVQLPGVESASCVDLDIYRKRLTLECAKPLYKLDLALSYPVDSDKGTAKFDKTKSTLKVTLPVLPPPLQTTHYVSPKQLVSKLEPELRSESESELPNQNENKLDKIPNGNSATEVESTTEDVDNNDADDSLDNSIVHTNLSTQGGPTISHTLAEEWISTGEWSCPPFSYQQDESTVTFILHTPSVKEKSLVANFDQSIAQLTYRATTGKSYSFCVSFDRECLLENDDCVVDISDDNVVVLLTKETRGLWENFQIGLNASQTEEKLFLTESNVQSAIEEIENFPNPWARNTLSESAQVNIVSQTESQLDIEVVDKKPSKNDTQPITNVSASLESLKIAPQKCKHPEICDKFDSLDEHQALSGSNSSTTAIKATTEEGSFVRVEADGSLFVRVDTDYLDSNEKDKLGIGYEKKGGSLQLSNELMFSMD